MPEMTAREYLSQAYELERKIRRLMRRRSVTISRATQATGRASAVRYGGTGKRSKLENAICEWSEVEGDINALIDEQVNVKREISKTIAKVEGLSCRKLLYYRYIRFWSWKRIAWALDMNFKYVRYELRDKAERKIHDILISS